MNVHTLRSSRSLQCAIALGKRGNLRVQCFALGINLFSQCRPSSSSTVATTGRAGHESSTTAEERSSLVNPPLSVLPPPLELPETPKDKPYPPSYYWRTGKAYLAFYKTACLNIWGNRKRATDLRVALPDSYSGSIPRAAADLKISRAEYQLHVRTQRDVSLVPFFGLLVLVCGELTPFIVLVLRGIVPPTAWIPKQVNMWRRQIEDRRRTAFDLVKEPVKAKATADDLSRMQLLLINASCGLSGKGWEWLFPGKEPGLPTWFLRRKVERWVEHLALDSRLLKTGGGPKHLSDEEVTRALIERGVNILQYDNRQRMDLLVAWMKSLQTTTPLKMLMTRPEAWMVKPKFLTP